MRRRDFLKQSGALGLADTMRSFMYAFTEGWHDRDPNGIDWMPGYNGGGLG